MQGKKNSNAQISSRKATGSRIGTQSNQSQNHSQSQNPSSNNINALKQREDALSSIVKQYLDKSGYPRSLQTFKNQKPVRRVMPTVSGKQMFNSSNQQKTIMNFFDKGNRDQFFKATDKIFTSMMKQNSQEIVHALRKLEFQLNIYFCIYYVHPATSGFPKKNQVQKSAAEVFKKYIESKGQQVSQESQLLAFYALPYIQKPQQNPSMTKVFTKQWINKIKTNLQQIIRQYTAKNTANSNKQNKKTSYTSTMHQIYDRYIESSVNQSRIKQQQSKVMDNKTIQKYERQIQELRLHNKQMVSYLDIMQQNIKDLNEASKTNLVQSNKKWFQFSKQILQLTKKALKGQNVKDKLQNYERFFGFNIDELIYCTDQISLFQKNSYTEDASMIPKNGPSIDKSAHDKAVQLTPIDFSKITHLFAKADKLQLQLQICLVLKALKDRLCYHRNAYLRRQVVVSYQRNDLCALKQINYNIQKKLLLESPDKVKQFYLRLMNYISTDDLGNQYLSGSQKLIQNLMSIMGSTSQQVAYRKHAIGILQKLSYIKQSQLVMISFGIIPMIFQIFRNEGDQLHETTIQYLMGLIMNLAVRKESIKNFQKLKFDILTILLKYIDVEDNQVKGYVNGTLYVLFQLQPIKKQAIQKFKINQILLKLHTKSINRLKELDLDDTDAQNCVIRQYQYILQRLNQPASNQHNYADDSDSSQQCVEDIQDMETFSDNQSNSSQFIQGQDHALSGQQLMMKKYALLGPQAVRQQIINKSILDQTGRKSNNMTTSINYTKRMDKVFHKNQRTQTPSLLPGSLDLSITPNR